MPTDKNEFTDKEREELASEPEMVIGTTAPKGKGFNFKVISSILIGIGLIAFLLIQFNVLGKKQKSPEDIEKENNAKTQTATPQAMQGINTMGNLSGSYQNPNMPQGDNTPNQAGVRSNQELTANQQKQQQGNNNGNNNGQNNPYNNPNYNNQQPYNQNGNGTNTQLPAPSPEQQALFEQRQHKRQLEENRIAQRESDEKERIKLINQERHQAMASPSRFNFSSRSAASASGSTNKNQAPDAKTSIPQMPNIQMPAMPNMNFGAIDLNKQKEKQDYLDAERSKPNYLKADLSYPVSRYQIMAGTIIPATFLTGLNSDLPGQIIGQVRENVYDTVRGRHLLIPQMTRIVGQYSSGVTFGQERVLMIWTRLIFPDGTSINLEGMPGVDLSGYAGVTDRVNRHFIKIATGAVFSSLMSAATKMAAGNQTAGNSDFAQLAASGAATSMSQAGDKIVSKMLDQQPTLEIRPGTKFNVFVNKDIILKPFKHRR